MSGDVPGRSRLQLVGPVRVGHDETVDCVVCRQGRSQAVLADPLQRGHVVFVGRLQQFFSSRFVTYLPNSVQTAISNTRRVRGIISRGEYNYALISFWRIGTKMNISFRHNIHNDKYMAVATATAALLLRALHVCCFVCMGNTTNCSFAPILSTAAISVHLVITTAMVTRNRAL